MEIQNAEVNRHRSKLQDLPEICRAKRNIKRRNTINIFRQHI